MSTVTVSVDVDVQQLRDLLCGAVEGGSGYWARFSKAERTPDLDYLAVTVTERESSTDGPAAVKRVRAEDLAQGIAQLWRGSFPAAHQHLANFLTGDEDAATADVILQLTIFRDVIYG